MRIKTNHSKAVITHSPLPITVLIFLLSSLILHAQQTEKVYLSGTGSNETKQWEFMVTGGMNAGKWASIAVPSCWELQGFGKYDYGFAKDSLRGKEKGYYKYQFPASANWKGKKVNLVFEGVMTDAEVKINGQLAGEIHQGAFYAFKYDISSLLQYGENNLLEITVSKHSSNESVNDAERRADFWIFGGIFRPVWLEILPEAHIKSVSINAKADGIFYSIADYTGKADKAIARIYSAEGKLLGTANAKPGNQGESFVFNSRIPNPRLWSPESPVLYRAEFLLYSGGKIVHTFSRKFGFRTVELRERDGIYVNGVKMKFKGVNRHSFRPETGRTTSRQVSIEDVQRMKDMNMNAVRMSHYPPDDHFLDVCDSLGLFVMDELAGWHGHYDTKTGSKLLQEMISHDVNHPSVILWANGNEGGHNFELDSLFAVYDIQQRPVVHPWQLFNGVETQHYREYNYGIGNYENGREIVMPTEFLHGQFDGGHGAGLEDYWEKMWKDPLSAGGFLWDFADNAVIRKDLGDSLDTDKHRAADGILGPHLEKEGSYFTIREVWSPVQFERKEITGSFDGKLNIENRYHFSNLNQCSFSWYLAGLNNGNSDTYFLKGAAVAPSVKPGEKGVLQLKLPVSWKNFDVLNVAVKDGKGREIYNKSFTIKRPLEVSNRIVGKTGKEIIQTPVADTNLLLVNIKDLRLQFSETNGMLVSVRNGKGEIPFNNGPVFSESGMTCKGIKHYRQDDRYIIESTFDKKESFNTLKWTIYPSGWVQLEVNYFPGAYFTSYAGINFSFPEKEIRSVTWMGDGPYRVWKNRMKGNLFGVWTKDYNNTETGEWPWKYPEFKGYHANVYYSDFYTRDNKFRVITETEDLFLRLFTPAWKTDAWHNYEPLFPPGDISFLQGISSIGSKTQRNETTGPMGGKNIFYDYEKDRGRALKIVLYFDFMAH